MDTAVLENIKNNSFTYHNNLEVISCTLNDLLFSNHSLYQTKSFWTNNHTRIPTSYVCGKKSKLIVY
jgi:hypothetical protein